jgi:uncharacterized protein YjaG (DUF416 family)
MKLLGLQLHKGELDQLPTGAKIILAAACTQRHSLNYHTFAGGAGSRRSKQFDAILEAIWRDIGYVQMSTEQLEILRLRAERLIPEEEHPYAGYAQLAAEALTCCVEARLYGDSAHILHITRRSFHSIWSFLPEVHSTWRTADGFLAPDADAKFAAHPLARDERLRQERDLNDVQRMVTERCSIADIVEHLEQRSKAESKAEALIPIRSGMPIDLTTVKLDKRRKRPRR